MSLKILSKYAAMLPSTMCPSVSSADAIKDDEEIKENCEKVLPRPDVCGKFMKEKLVQLCPSIEENQSVSKSLSGVGSKVSLVKDLVEKRLAETVDQLGSLKEQLSQTDISHHLHTLEQQISEQILASLSSIRTALVEDLTRMVEYQLALFLKTVRTEITRSQDSFHSNWLNQLVQVEEKLIKERHDQLDQHSTRIDAIQSLLTADKHELQEEILTHRSQLHTLLSTSREIALEKLKNEIKMEFITLKQMDEIKKSFEKQLEKQGPAPCASCQKSSLEKSINPQPLETLKNDSDILKESTQERETPEREARTPNKESTISNDVIDLTLSDSDQDQEPDNTTLLTMKGVSVPAKRSQANAQNKKHPSAMRKRAKRRK